MLKKRQKQEPAEQYNPVLHDQAFHDKLLAKSGVKAAYDAQEEEYAALHVQKAMQQFASKCIVF